MKSPFWLFLVLISLVSLVSAQDRDTVFKMVKEPVPFLEEIRKSIRDRDLSWEGDKSLGGQIQGLAYAINQEILAANSTDWANPSPERVKVIKKWGKTLAPYTKELLAVAMEKRGNLNRASTQARSILDFAPSTPEFEAEVRVYFTENDQRTLGNAALLLSEHGLLTQKDMDFWKDLIKSSSDPTYRERGVMGLSYYGVTDGMELARKDFQSEPGSGDIFSLLTQYKEALEFAQNLGPAAKPILPDLEALIKKIEDSTPEEPGARLHRNFTYTRDLISGKVQMTPKVAKNGSGPLQLKAR